MSLIASLNTAFARNPNPDEIVRLIGDPFQNFIRIRDMTPELFACLQQYKPGVAFYNFRSRVWDASRPVASVTKHGPSNFKGPSGTWPSLDELQRYLVGWAIVGYEHRLNVNPETMSWT